jgi:hypothetical protein
MKWIAVLLFALVACSLAEDVTHQYLEDMPEDVQNLIQTTGSSSTEDDAEEERPPAVMMQPSLAELLHSPIEKMPGFDDKPSLAKQTETLVAVGPADEQPASQQVLDREERFEAKAEEEHAKNPDADYVDTASPETFIQESIATSAHGSISKVGRVVNINGDTKVSGEIKVTQGGRFASSVTVDTKTSHRLRLGDLDGNTGVFAESQDKKPVDLHIGAVSGAKVYVGDGKKDFAVTAGSGDVWIRGGLSIGQHLNLRNGGDITGYMFVKAENQKLRVGAAWGMPGIYSGDNAKGNKDLILGAPAGNRVYFGVNKKDAYIEAGKGNAVFSGNVNAARGSFSRGARVTGGNVKITSKGQTLTAGTTGGTPGIHGGKNNVAVAVAKGRKVLFGYKNADAYIVGGTGFFFTKGSIRTESALSVKAGGDFGDNTRVTTKFGTVRVGSSYNMPGVYAKGSSHLSLGVKKGMRVYMGVGTTDAYVTAGEGTLTLTKDMNAGGKVSATAGASFGNYVHVEAEKASLRVGAAWGIAGIYSSKDIIVGAASHRRVHIGRRGDAWIESGTGNANIRGNTGVGGNLRVGGSGSVQGEMKVSADKASVTVTPAAITSSGSTGVFAPAGSTISVGSKAGEFSVAAGTGDVKTTGKIVASGSVSAGAGSFSANVRVGPVTVGSVGGVAGITGKDLHIQGATVHIGSVRGEATVNNGAAFFKGSLTAGAATFNGGATSKGYHFVLAEKQRLRVGAAWGMPGLYASDNGKRDLMLGTAPGKRVYFGVHRRDAYIVAGSGNAWFKGQATASRLSISGAAVIGGGATIRRGKSSVAIGETDGSGSITSDNGLVFKVADGKRVKFGADAYIEGGSGNAVFRGNVSTTKRIDAVKGASFGGNVIVKVGKAEVGLGASGAAAGLWVSGDAYIATGPGKKTYIGNPKNAWVDSDTGDAWFRGTLNIGGQVYIATSNPDEKVAPTTAPTPGAAPTAATPTKAAPKRELGEYLRFLEEENTSLKSRLSQLEANMTKMMTAMSK